MRFVPLFFLLSGCLVTVDDFGKKSCRTAADCPGVAGYLCAATSTWPQRACKTDGGDDGCLCEVRFPPEVGGISIDGGTPPVPDAGPPPDYCTEIKPIIQLNCIGTCHGPQMQYAGTQDLLFRFDYWEPGPQHAYPDGGLLPGVKVMVPRMVERMYVRKDMPPTDFPLVPTTAQITLFNKWATKFGAPLGDGGCEVYGGDGGSSGGDSGVPDAGVVSFAADVLPIFAGNCNCHTGANTSGMLSLTAANAYNQLVNINVSAGCLGGIGGKRVLANAPMQSQLWLKLSNNANKCGALMPRGAAMPLSASNPAAFDKIDRWIRQGAPNN